MGLSTLGRESTHDSLQGGDIVQLILDHGKLRPPEIFSQLLIYDPKGTYVAQRFVLPYQPQRALQVLPSIPRRSTN